MSFAQIGLIHALSKGVVQSELLTIILRPEKVNEVLELLDELGVDWMCLSQVEGVGRQRGHTEIFRGREYSIEPCSGFHISLGRWIENRNQKSSFRIFGDGFDL